MKRLDINGNCKYNQLKRTISPKYCCFPTSLITAYEIIYGNDSFEHLNSYHKDLDIVDKLTYFSRYEPVALQIYNLYEPKLYKQWLLDETKDKDLYSDNSYPPNELWKIIVADFNLFINMNKQDSFTTHASIVNASNDNIKHYLDDNKPLIISCKVGNISGHMVTIVGYDDVGFYIYDSYGCKGFEQYQTINKAKLIPYNDFNKMFKPCNQNKKLVVVMQ